jgi:hypothetical protein
MDLNEVLQWTVLVILTLVMLGVLRQLSVMLPADVRGSSGPDVGKRAPAPLLKQVEQAVSNGGLSHGAVVAFVTEHCVGCQKLLADLTEGRQTTNGYPVVVVADNPSGNFRAALDETPLPVIADRGELWSACGVTATPLVVRIDQAGRITNKEVTHRVDEVAHSHS